MPEPRSAPILLSMKEELRNRHFDKMISLNAIAISMSTIAKHKVKIFG